MKYTIHHASFDDLQGIQNLLYPEYFNETGYSYLDYDAESTTNQIKSWLSENINVVIKFGESVVAFASMAICRTFYKQVEADIEMFVVSLKHRGTQASRMLVEGLIFQAKQNNAAVMYSGCLSGINEKNNQLFVNLWQKYGFEKLGTVMIGKL